MWKKLNLILSLIFSSLFVIGCLSVVYLNNSISFLFSLILPILWIINIFYLIYYSIGKKIYFIPFVISVGLYFGLFDSFYQINISKTLPKMGSFSVLTFNTQGFKKYKQNIGSEDEIVNFIKNEKPDIFCIQEFSAIKYKEFNEYPFWYKTNIIARNKSVMAIFSKFPIMDKGYINFPNSSNGAMFVDIVYTNQIFRIYNIHLQSFSMNKNMDKDSGLFKKISETTNLQKEQAEIIKNHIQLFKGKVILVGDFNSTQFSLPYSLIKDKRKDSFIEAGYGFGATFSWFDYPLRLDFILCDKDINVVAHKNYKIGLSDHEPIMAELKFN